MRLNHMLCLILIFNWFLLSIIFQLWKNANISINHLFLHLLLQSVIGSPVLMQNEANVRVRNDRTRGRRIT